MIELTRDMQGIEFKLQRINTGALWNIYEALKVFGKVTALERKVLLIHLN